MRSVGLLNKGLVQSSWFMIAKLRLSALPVSDNIGVTLPHTNLQIYSMVAVFLVGNKLRSPFLSYRKDIKIVIIPKERDNSSLRQFALKMWHELWHVTKLG